jgi:signal transduction histidine kinase
MRHLHTFFFKYKTVKKVLLPLIFLFINPVYSQVTDSALTENIYNKGLKYIYINPDSAAWFFENAKKESETRKYLPGIVMYHNFNAALQIALNQNQKAFDYYDTAIAIAQKYNLVTDLGLSYIKKGILNQLMGEYAHAAECYLIAASLLKTNADRKKVIGLYKNIITTLNNLQQQNQSLQNVLPALKNDNVNEKEIVSILSQKTTNETSLDFPDQTTLSETTFGGIYVIFGGAKFYIADFYVLGNYSNYRSIRKIPDGMISRIPDIPREGTILRQTNDGTKVYLIKDKMRHLIENPKVLEFFGGWDALCIVPENGLKQVPDAGDLVTLQNVSTTFNFKQEYEVLIDTLKTALSQNTWLLSEVGKKLKEKNNKLQNRKILLWTFLVGIVALLSIGILLLRNFRQKQKLHQQSLKALKAEDELKGEMELEKERTRIASDMHDDLGAGLTRIKFIAENISEKTKDAALQPDIKKLKTSSIELVENMAEIIWAMNEKNNSLEDLVFYLRSYAVDYCNENGLACEFTLPENIPAKIIGGEVRRNVFLILKESLHNIVKHAGAKKVTINFKADEMLSLVIADDGRGYEKKTEQNGNGLLNMEQRSKALKGKFSISNNSGTVIHFEMPV